MGANRFDFMSFSPAFGLTYTGKIRPSSSFPGTRFRDGAAPKCAKPVFHSHLEMYRLWTRLLPAVVATKKLPRLRQTRIRSFR
jgi:hypothetical protein